MLRGLLLLVFVTFSTVTSTPIMEITNPDALAMISSMHKLCVAKTGVQEASIEEAKKGILDRDPKLMVYWTCVWTTSGIMDQTGNIDYDLFGSLVPPENRDLLLKLVKTCHDKAAGEKVLTTLVLKLTQCIKETDFEHFIIF